MYRRIPAPFVLVVAAALLPGGGLAPWADAGCLAPRDANVDLAGAVGPFWGNPAGELLYTRDVTGEDPTLLVRELEAAGGIVAESGEGNGFLVGIREERWAGFHAGTLNGDGDIGLVASTTIPDDPATPQNEGLARRGAYFRRSNTLYRIGRFGLESPIDDAFGDPVPWGSFFDVVATGRDGLGFGTALVTAQLGAPDGRTGIWRFEEQTFDLTPLLLVGDPSPAGGTFQTIARTRANEAGDAAVFAVTQTGGGATSAGLFLRQSDGSSARLVKFGTDGDTPPGGGRFSILNDFAIDDGRTVYFAASLGAAAADSGLFRAAPPLFVPETVVLEGDRSPLGGQYGTFEFAQVRAGADGAFVFAVPLSDDVGGDGIFVLPAGGGTPLPLANPDGITAVAAVSTGSAAYQTATDTHVVLPPDPDEEGPDDFRISRVDLRNKVPLRADGLRASGGFRLPQIGDGPDEIAPVVFGDAPQERRTLDRVWTDGELDRVIEVIVTVSQTPGNEFRFGIDNAGTPTFRYNGAFQKTPRLKVAKDGTSARWSFSSATGRGRLTVDLDAETYDLRLSRGTLQPSFEPLGFRVRVTLKTRDDVLSGREDADSLFHEDLRIDAEQPSFGKGRRVRSDGRGVPGGTLFLDTLRVKRKLRAKRGQVAPDVVSDSVLATGAIILCPGSTAPSTPGLNAGLTVGDLVLTDLAMDRRGKSGSRYRYKSPRGELPRVVLDVDLVKGTFKVKATRVPPLPLADADFSGADPANTAAADVAGLSLPFALDVARAYADAFDVPMVRRKGGKLFER